MFPVASDDAVAVPPVATRVRFCSARTPTVPDATLLPDSGEDSDMDRGDSFFMVMSLLVLLLILFGIVASLL